MAGPMEPSGRLWPNGEFSIGYARAGGLERELTPSEYAQKWDGHLGLSLPSNSHSRCDPGKPKRGTRGLTSHGKKVLRNAVWRMQRLYGKRCLSFVTLTLPDVTYEESWYISSNWSTIVRVFYQKLGRRLESRGLPGTYAGCTEMQPIRSGRDGHPALHLHFLVVGRRRPRGSWAIDPDEFREIWASVLEVYIGRPVDYDAVENVQMVRKDASSYMAKYVSKGCSMEEPPRSDETGWSLPTAWYNVSLRLRQWVLDQVRRSPGLMEAIEKECVSGTLVEFCHYLFAGEIEQMSGSGPHYWVGKLRGEAVRELTDYWRGVTIDISPYDSYNLKRLRMS